MTTPLNISGTSQKSRSVRPAVRLSTTGWSPTSTTGVSLTLARGVSLSLYDGVALSSGGLSTTSEEHSMADADGARYIAPSSTSLTAVV